MSYEVTHNSVHDCVLAEQNNFARRTDEPLPVCPLTSSLSLPERELLNCPADGVRDANIVVRREGNGPSLHQGVAEIVKQVRRVFDADTQADEILRKTTRGASGRVDRGVPSSGDSSISMKG